MSLGYVPSCNLGPRAGAARLPFIVHLILGLGLASLAIAFSAVRLHQHLAGEKSLKDLAASVALITVSVGYVLSLPALIVFFKRCCASSECAANPGNPVLEDPNLEEYGQLTFRAASPLSSSSGVSRTAGPNGRSYFSGSGHAASLGDSGVGWYRRPVCSTSPRAVVDPGNPNLEEYGQLTFRAASPLSSSSGVSRTAGPNGRSYFSGSGHAASLGDSGVGWYRRPVCSTSPRAVVDPGNPNLEEYGQLTFRAASPLSSSSGVSRTVSLNNLVSVEAEQITSRAVSLLSNRSGVSRTVSLNNLVSAEAEQITLRAASPLSSSSGVSREEEKEGWSR
ncbi:hypothetical protein [Neorickettsia sennetsu]|uniref:Uncharacterized protein n=1 Tax=Ehrlichia sennetsu (strain ATCC VR-367 / Miyayama) TaxID=222891 RepID=Q2GEQ2_EHRS3|nr:hypothetical protein [Neorickettsia sennetsu]ABD46363.1 hypothetical protein NSE_0145 [Neorickettsia sennetsu str. Miyayama]